MSLYGGVFFSSEVALIPGSVLISISAYFFLVLFYSPGVFVFVFRYSHVYLDFFLRLVHSVPLGGNCVTIYSNTVIIKVIRSMMLVPSSW